ncbi:DNA polymerase II [Paraglaciecola sp. 2405UD69-4]|uniref:DNA polymerase II n=1 Tax=Paraglaciecola sp. 2405UD69-4 TaxID=3391836 RepID=UPI0039C98AFE
MSEIFEGFVLTSHAFDRKGKTFLDFWFLTANGPVKGTTEAQRGVFFVRQCDGNQISELLSTSNIKHDYKPLALSTFEHELVGGMYFDTTSALYQARNLLKRHRLPHFEADIRLTDRFLMERFVYGSAKFTGHIQTATFTPSLIDINCKPSKFVPEFKILSLDIECSDKGHLYSIGMAGQDFQVVLMIGAKQAGPEWVEWVEDEKELLVKCIEQLNQFDPDLIIGWNIVNFDFRLLVKRAEVYGVSFNIGRDGQPLAWRDSRSDNSQGFVSIAGRLVIDGIEALKTATYQFDSFSLENVAQELLGRGKKTEDIDNRMAHIEHDFLYDKPKLAEYNLEDCRLVLDIFEKTRVLDFLVLRSQLTGLELDRMGGSVAAFINLYLPKLHRSGYIAPNRPADGGLASPGGYVMSSKPGLYENVLVLDYKSLYPSIIRTFKIDPLGLVEGLKSPQSAIEGYRGAKFSRDKHFLPHIIESLWNQRDEAKRNKDGPRSQAIKILMNSFYGVLGSGGCPFYDTRLASSITMRGHDIMQTTANWIEEAGYQVIYGDTDSTFVWLEGDYTEEAAASVGKSLADMINQNWGSKLKEEFELACELEIEFETHFKHFLMPTIRGSELGSKKRYAGVKATPLGDELVFKGLETVRSDWTLLAKQFQLTLYKMVFAKEDVTQYIQDVVQNTRKGNYDELLVYRKRLRRKLAQYVKNVPPHVKAARIADEKNVSLGKPSKYQNKAWVSYLITVNGPEPIEYQTSKIDYEHYIEKQVRPIAEGILPFIGVSFEEVTGQQLGLF